jgi:hypothetical protein
VDRTAERLKNARVSEMPANGKANFRETGSFDQATIVRVLFQI